MIGILHQVEAMLPDMLLDGQWKSVFVDYHAPFVERLWRNVDIEGVTYRVYLHRIHPCPLNESLFHPHPWPSAMKILSGEYTMLVGFGTGMNAPPVAATLLLPPGAEYEMINPDSWHAVSPNDTPSYSLMVSGPPWERESHKSTKVLEPLSQKAQDSIINAFSMAYP